MPIFRVKSVKIYTGQKNLHGYIRGIRDKYEVCVDDGDDDEKEEEDYNLPSKMFFSIKQSASILFSFTMLLLFMFGTFAFFIISLDLFCSNIAGPSLIEINEKL